MILLVRDGCHVFVGSEHSSQGAARRGVGTVDSSNGGAGELFAMAKLPPGGTTVMGEQLPKEKGM